LAQAPHRHRPMLIIRDNALHESVGRRPSSPAAPPRGCAEDARRPRPRRAGRRARSASPAGAWRLRLVAAIFAGCDTTLSGASADVAPGPEATRGHADPGCPANCAGRCFGGQCLFGGVGLGDDDFFEDAKPLPPLSQLKEAPPPTAPSAWASPASLAGSHFSLPPSMQPQPFGPLSAQDRQWGSMPEGLTALPPTLRGGGLAAAPPAAGGPAPAAVGGSQPFPLSSPLAEGLGGSGGGGGGAGAAAWTTMSGDVPGTGGAPGGQLSAWERLRMTEVESERLQRENGALRNQLGVWRTAGAHVAAREARIVDLLGQHAGGGGHGRGGAAAAAAPASVAAAVGTAGARSVVLPMLLGEGASAAAADSNGLYEAGRLVADAGQQRPVKASNLLLCIEFFSIVLAACIAYQARGCILASVAGAVGLGEDSAKMPLRGGPPRGGAGGAQGVAAPATALGRAALLLAPLGRLLGLGGGGHCVVEVSEVHLGHIDAVLCPAPGGHVSVAVRGGGREDWRARRTRPVEYAGDAFLAFPEVLHVHVSPTPTARPGDSERWCVISVWEEDAAGEGDRDVEVARVEVPAREFLTNARSRQEYFRFDLLPGGGAFRRADPRRRGDEAAARSGERPYVAMRLRDVTREPHA